MDHYKFFQNRDCEFFPCHQGMADADFNCLFCFCPLYVLGDRCGGSYCYSSEGVKDCSGCVRPHRKENYDWIMHQLGTVLKLAAKPINSPEKP